MSAAVPQPERLAFDSASIKLVGDPAPSDPRMVRMMELAGAVKAAQDRKQEAYHNILRAQDEMQVAASALLEAEAEFQAIAPTLWGIAPPLTRNDAVGEWLRARCDLGSRLASTRSSVLFEDFLEWVGTVGVHGNPKDWSPIKFGRQLSDRGFDSRKLNGGLKVRVGIRLRELDRDNG